ncbi:MAG: cell division protein SepF [Prochlorococcaceae cyanobacterium]
MLTDSWLTAPTAVEPQPRRWDSPGYGRQVLVFTPRSFCDARRVIEAVRAHHTVLVNSAWLEDSPGQRLIDFVCGGTAAICGQVHRIAEEVFLFAPGDVLVHGDCGAAAARPATDAMPIEAYPK